MVLTQYHVKTAWQNRFLEVLDEYVRIAATKEGNIMSAAYYERGDACIMWIVERWSSHTFYKQNKKSTDAKAVGAFTKMGLSSPPETTFVKELESFSKEVNQDALTIMLFIDVKAGTEKQFISINRNLAPVLQEAPGVLFYQLSQVINNKTRFVVCKQFRDWDTFRYHLQEPALQPVLIFLQTSIKEPPFEKGYHHLIPFAPQ
ncbi:Quinol monooxygenase YgiN [Filimonas lacunae]|uniref:Quinol monooxygenase YgiN n=2 Tax=Filimonas lacunae TaxID=477680 RepID=A0A173MC29_9BACT|nr:hypothetical protein FLA_1044 [Filimonas lacunae]SIT33606.1 Quinol monooxygenase YgiN [Filimonas lacunae]